MIVLHRRRERSIPFFGRREGLEAPPGAERRAAVSRARSSFFGASLPPSRVLWTDATCALDCRPGITSVFLANDERSVGQRRFAASLAGCGFNVREVPVPASPGVLLHRCGAVEGGVTVVGSPDASSTFAHAEDGGPDLEIVQSQAFGAEWQSGDGLPFSRGSCDLSRVCKRCPDSRERCHSIYQVGQRELILKSRTRRRVDTVFLVTEF